MSNRKKVGTIKSKYIVGTIDYNNVVQRVQNMRANIDNFLIERAKEQYE